jgi:hypothetical protein
MRSRFGEPRASRIADMVASVPELHMRTFSTDGTHSQMVRAISTSKGFGMPKEIPLLRDLVDGVGDGHRGVAEDVRAPRADVVDVGLAVDVLDPAAMARRTKNGSPPTLRKARTGEFTPPGMYSLATANIFWESGPGVCMLAANREEGFSNE